MRKSAIFAIFLGFWVQPAAADVWNRDWTVSGSARVRVDADDGNIRVETADSDRVRAVVRTAGWRISEDEVRVLERQSGDLVEIEVRVPRRVFNWSLRREISIELTVPRQAGLDLHTGDGNIGTRGVEGPLRCDTGDGNISAVGAKGTIRLRTGDGNIDADELDGSVTAATGDGNLNVTGRFDAVDLQTGDGNIEATAHAGSQLSSPWRLRTGDGNIALRLPEGVAADLEADTGDGRVTCDFPVTISGSGRPNSLRGPMNGGGPPLSLRTGDGNIRIAGR